MTTGTAGSTRIILDGIDNDGDGRTDEDLANDPVYDGVMLHELTHSYHDDFGLFASWAEEGMNECAAELVAEYLYRNKIRDVRGRTPQVNLQYFDAWNTMGPDVMGGTAYSFYKSLPDLIYRGAPALFFTLAATQSPTYAGYPAGYTYLAALNAALRQRKIGGSVSESAFYEAVDAAVASPQPVDGILPVSRWVRSRAVANTVSRSGGVPRHLHRLRAHGHGDVFHRRESVVLQRVRLPAAGDGRAIRGTPGKWS